MIISQSYHGYDRIVPTINKYILTLRCLQGFFCIFASCAITGAHHGTGQHAKDIPPDELPLGLKVSPISTERRQLQRSLTVFSSGGFASPST